VRSNPYHQQPAAALQSSTIERWLQLLCAVSKCLSALLCPCRACLPLLTGPALLLLHRQCLRRYGESQVPEGDERTISNLLLDFQAAPLNAGYNMCFMFHCAFPQEWQATGTAKQHFHSWQ
jgi:hypothetical protein